jgi:hypothetical protein
VSKRWSVNIPKRGSNWRSGTFGPASDVRGVDPSEYETEGASPKAKPPPPRHVELERTADAMLRYDAKGGRSKRKRPSLGAIPPERKGGPSLPQMIYAMSLSQRAGLGLPRGWAKRRGVCAEFIDKVRAALGKPVRPPPPRSAPLRRRDPSPLDRVDAAMSIDGWREEKRDRVTVTADGAGEIDGVPFVAAGQRLFR